MSSPQNTIAIVYDYDQTLSSSYMQDEVVFPAFGITRLTASRSSITFISSGLKVLIDGSRLAPYVRAIFGCEYATDSEGRISFLKRVISHTQKPSFSSALTKGFSICRKT